MIISYATTNRVPVRFLLAFSHTLKYFATASQIFNCRELYLSGLTLLDVVI